MLSKKYYVAIAKVICNIYTQSSRNEISSHGLKTIVHSFADLFQADNPNFDRQRFIDYVYECIGG